MRLHNRQVKASFWTDTDLIRLLDIPGRMFYQGLWQLADDSGCLEYDTLAFKIQLFPADEEVTEETIKEWLKKLIEAKKLIEYESEGKKCLFLKNFHKHQKLKNCSPPQVPLPDWITWEPYPSNDRQGKYVINEDMLTNFLQGSYNGLQTSSNHNHNHNQNHNRNQNYIKSNSENPTPPEDPQNEESQEETELESKPLTPQEVIFEHWNSKGIIQHRKLTNKIKRAINGALRDYTEEELCCAIDNYAVILSDDKYYWTHKWTLKEFIERGIDKFLDFDTAAQNYLIDNKTRGDPDKPKEPKSWGTLRALYRKYEQEEADEIEKNRNGPITGGH